MKTLKSALFAAALAATACATSATAEPPVDPRGPTVGASINSVEVRIEGHVAHGYRASKFMLAPVKNDDGDTIGRIQDILISGSGDANYAIVGVGGFLGIGDDKLVAIPASLLEVDAKGHVTLPGGSKAKLEAMAPFRWS